ncbi:TetR/AcrR family transcriptional regulator [Clostridium sp. YIM B02505]|uniref:TetR/AcrR family transcriptional regulator n=1 Tax=Clostridium yunnanense TaxID=2800325 RepID=A0ABS1EKU6_9CLOT|nr:TetR family transcriptional regulator [Clostridium yunnanense]MBK1809985.1 TetR/AcrR family transcriptional regulator [Clostridium yunnanense]
MREFKSVEDKILDKALYLIGQNRTLDVSVRAIAKEANVNVSAINYYFRSKEEMLRQVKQFFLTNTLTILSIIDNDEYNDEEKLILAANEIMEYILRFPGVTVIIRDALSQIENDELSLNIVNSTNEMHGKLEKILCKLTENNKISSKHKMSIFMASIIHPLENNDIMEFTKGIADTKEERIEYIKNIIKALSFA